MVHAIPVSFVTPAEAQVLSIIHKVGAQDEVISNVSVTGVLDRTDKVELARLRGKYGAKAVDPLWPGLNPKLPQTFEEAGIHVGVEPAPVAPNIPDLPEAPVEAAPDVEPAVEAPVEKPAPKKSKKTLP